MTSTGVVVDLAKSGPPEGETGTLSPNSIYGEAGIFGAYMDWDRGQGSPSEKQLQAMLDRDGKAQALEAVLTLPLRWASTSIKPHKDDSGEAEFVTEALTTPPWDGGMSTPLEQVIAHMTSAVVFRKAFMEKVWRVIETGAGPRWSYDKLAPRPAESCRLVKDPKTGNFRGFKQRVPFDHPNADENGQVTFEPEKAFVYIHDWAKHPLCGRSALETAYRAYEAKQKVRYLWFVFLDRLSGGWGLAKDEGGDPGNADSLARKTASLRSGGVLGLGKDQTVELLEPTSDGEAYKSCMDWLGSEMAQSVLAGFLDLTTGATGTGSYALSADQSDFFLRSRYAVLSEMGSALTNYVVADLVRWNFPGGKCPTFEFGRLTNEHAAELMTLFTQLASQSAPNPQIPVGFVDLIMEKLAAVLELDEGKVRDLLAARAPGDATSPEGFNNLMGGATQLLAEAGVTPTGVAATPLEAV